MTEIYKTPKHLHIQECDSDGNIRTVKYYREDIINDFVIRIVRDLQRIQDEADGPQTEYDKYREKIKPHDSHKN